MMMVNLGSLGVQILVTHRYTCVNWRGTSFIRLLIIHGHFLVIVFLLVGKLKFDDSVIRGLVQLSIGFLNVFFI